MQLQPAASEPPRSFLEQLGIHPPFLWGYVGLLFFMIGDGVEAGYLSKYLVDRGISSEQNAALILTVYGITAAIAAWLSGALSDLWGPRQVMAIGLAIWVVFELGFLLLGIAPASYEMTMLMYALRGFGYPLFAYGFLVWLSVATPKHRLGTAMGWFWFALTGGFLTIGPFFARVAIPLIGEDRGPYITLWLSLVLVIVGGAIALLGVHEPIGKHRLAPPGAHPIRTLFLSIPIAWQYPKTAIGCIVRIINTAPQAGFLALFPIYYVDSIGFTREQWLEILGFMFLSNVIWNLLFGFIGEKFGWRQTVAICGGIGCAITTLLLHYIPIIYGPNYPLTVLAAMLYGATLAGYVPLSALMPSLVPENKGAAMSLLNLGAGASGWAGPAIVYLFWKPFGVGAVMWIYAVLYLISAGLALTLTLPEEEAAARTAKPMES